LSWGEGGKRGKASSAGHAITRQGAGFASPRRCGKEKKERKKRFFACLGWYRRLCAEEEQSSIQTAGLLLCTSEQGKEGRKGGEVNSAIKRGPFSPQHSSCLENDIAFLSFDQNGRKRKKPATWQGFG